MMSARAAAGGMVRRGLLRTALVTLGVTVLTASATLGPTGSGVASASATEAIPALLPGAVLLGYEGTADHNADMFDATNRDSSSFQQGTLSPDGTRFVYLPPGQPNGNGAATNTTGTTVTWKVLDTSTATLVTTFSAPAIQSDTMAWAGHEVAYLTGVDTSPTANPYNAVLHLVNTDTGTVVDTPVPAQPSGFPMRCSGSGYPTIGGLAGLPGDKFRVLYVPDRCGLGNPWDSDVWTYDTTAGSSTGVWNRVVFSGMPVDDTLEHNAVISADGRFVAAIVYPTGTVSGSNREYVERVDLSTSARTPLPIDRYTQTQPLAESDGVKDNLVISDDGSRFTWDDYVTCHGPCHFPYKYVVMTQAVTDGDPSMLTDSPDGNTVGDATGNPVCLYATGITTSGDCLSGGVVGFMPDNKTAILSQGQGYGSWRIDASQPHNPATAARLSGAYVTPETTGGVYTQAEDAFNGANYQDLGYASGAFTMWASPGVSLSTGAQLLRVRDTTGARSLWYVPTTETSGTFGASAGISDQSATVIRPHGSITLTSPDIRYNGVGVFATPTGGTYHQDSTGYTDLEWATNANNYQTVARTSPTQVTWTDLTGGHSADPNYIYPTDAHGFGPHTLYLATNSGHTYPFTFSVYPQPEYPNVTGGSNENDTLTLNFTPPTNRWGDEFTGYVLHCGDRTTTVPATARSISMANLTSALTCQFAATDGAGDGKAIPVNYAPAPGDTSSTGDDTGTGDGSHGTGGSTTGSTGSNTGSNSVLLPAPAAAVVVHGHRVTLTATQHGSHSQQATGRLVVRYTSGSRYPTSPTAGKRWGRGMSGARVLRVSRRLPRGTYRVSVFTLRPDGAPSNVRHLKFRVRR